MSIASCRSIKLFLAFKFLHQNIALTQHYFKYEDVGTHVPVILQFEEEYAVLNAECIKNGFNVKWIGFLEKCYLIHYY